MLKLGLECLVLPVSISQDLLAHDLKEPDKEATGPAGGIADHIAFLRIDHANHEFNDRAGSEELPDFASEGATQEALKRNAL